MSAQYQFKVANRDSEFEQISRLNYQTFVEEIPQHSKNESGQLVDKFHHENTYLICLRGIELVGMMALRDQRPFSLDAKLDDLDSYLSDHKNLVEIRLLSVAPGIRNGRVLKGLLNLLIEVNQTKHWDMAVISGTTRQQRLYQHIGFEAFGPLVGSDGAQYQPMSISLQQFESHTQKLLDHETLFFLPGPVNISDPVKKAFRSEPYSHRSTRFNTALTEVKDNLKGLTGAQNATLALGSGTLANEMVAAQISALGKQSRGLILSNGEFGGRLIDHAYRWGLNFQNYVIEWGQPFDYAEIDHALNESYDWLWMVACETSTGVKNDVERLSQTCERRQIKICLDCVSAVGSYPLDLSRVYLASSASGKALASYPGLAIIFSNFVAQPNPSIPQYLDLGNYSNDLGTPFTQSTNLVEALSCAVSRFTNHSALHQECAQTRKLSERLRVALGKMGYPILAEADISTANVMTLPLSPIGIDARQFANELADRFAIKIAYESGYLEERNWVQICLMGEQSEKRVDRLIEALKDVRDHL